MYVTGNSNTKVTGFAGGYVTFISCGNTKWRSLSCTEYGKHFIHIGNISQIAHPLCLVKTTASADQRFFFAITVVTKEYLVRAM